jgi:hypothetical protein
MSPASHATVAAEPLHVRYAHRWRSLANVLSIVPQAEVPPTRSAPCHRLRAVGIAWPAGHRPRAQSCRDAALYPSSDLRHQAIPFRDRCHLVTQPPGGRPIAAAEVRRLLWRLYAPSGRHAQTESSMCSSCRPVSSRSTASADAAFTRKYSLSRLPSQMPSVGRAVPFAGAVPLGGVE